jgi:pimeloyl-ACP methyl ester carboxylesterase
VVVERPLEMRSADGTLLAVWIGGAGPAVVLVHGSASDHTTLTPFLDELRRTHTTYAMDRRGFGASEDGPAYAIEREFEDVAAVVDAVAARVGGPVGLFGHSFGAACAMGGAALTGNVRGLVLYEPSLGLRYPPGTVAAAEAALAGGDRDAAVATIFADVLGFTEEDIAAMRASRTPTWETRLACAHTLPRECAAEEAWIYAPGSFEAITAPTLLLVGSESPPDLAAATRAAAAAIPVTHIHVLDGHAHMAHKTDPPGVAAILRAFLGNEAPGRPA